MQRKSKSYGAERVSGLALPDSLGETLCSTGHRIIVTSSGGWIGSAKSNGASKQVIA
jgi:hypothetical protein